MKKTKELPKVKYNGKEYYIDIRLKEFRSVKPPLEFISFDSVAGDEIIECMYKLYQEIVISLS